MCNRYELESHTAANILLRIDRLSRATDEAQAWEPLAYQAPNSTALCIVEQDGEWILRTATWGFKHPRHGTPVFNTRTDSAPADLVPHAYRHEAPPRPLTMWQGLRRCWIPATAWLECPQPKTRTTAAVWLRMALGGDLFLLAGVCGERDQRYRMSMLMTETPETLPAIRAGHTRMPLAYGVDAIGEGDPRPIHTMIEVGAV